MYKQLAINVPATTEKAKLEMFNVLNSKSPERFNALLQPIQQGNGKKLIAEKKAPFQNAFVFIFPEIFLVFGLAFLLAQKQK